MNIQETQNTSNQSCYTANKRSRSSNSTGRCQYTMYLQNSVLYNFGIKYFNFQPSDFSVLQSRKLKLCRGCMFLNAVKIMLFISDVQYFVPIKLCKTMGSIHLFKSTGMLIPEKVKSK